VSAVFTRINWIAVHVSTIELTGSGTGNAVGAAPAAGRDVHPLRC
jgi:hypothetical protein